MKKAIFFDIDGTLWDKQQQIPDSTKEALALLKEKGHYLFISSGRTKAFIPEKKLMQFGFDGILAGCGTYGEFQEEVKYYHKIPLSQIQQDCEFLNKIGATYVLEGRHYLYMDEERFPEGDPFPIWMRNTLAERLLPIRGNENQLEVSKMSVNYMDNIKQVEEEFSKRYQIIHHREKVMEIVPKGLNKATGIQEICKLLGIAREDTYAFGDSRNDLEMLEYVAHSVAMGNGTQELKDVAEYVTTDLWDNGIYNGLKFYGLI
ncbi:MAG: Cof-type HAD-IIB family hydrolase [Lachnospiraceae bacterium]